MTPVEALPDRDEFHRLAAEHAVVPVTRRLLADGETPIGVYRKLAGGPGSFLLESAEHGRSWSRYSFIGVRCPAVLVESGGVARWQGDVPAGVPLAGEPFPMLKASAAALTAPRLDGLPPLLGGLVGFVSYDAVRRLERLPDHAVRDLEVPDLHVLLATDIAVLDHSDGSVLLVADVLTRRGPVGDTEALPRDALDAAYDDALGRLDAMTADLDKAAPSTVARLGLPTTVPVPSRFPGFRRAVARAVEQIEAGECFQVVVSQRFERPTTAGGLDIYRVLRAINPSPYMYLLRFEGHDVVGSSPEALVTVTSGRARLHPIAGTRWRGATPEEDAQLAAELLADPKERSEHVMLVDLGRNDLGRVCRPGTVRVVEFGTVERYSHVMHIVSTVVGEVSPGCDAVDVLAATFPAGTLSGAPKPRAMEIIDELEPTRRGLYGGAIVYVDFAGDLDSAIAIRTAFLRDGVAYVQAGGGIVADSDPAAEDDESRNKAAAVLHAIGLAETLAPPR